MSRSTCSGLLNSVQRTKDRGQNHMMTTRWVIAAAGALGVGVLTASALLGPTQHVQSIESQAAAGEPAERGAGGCQADKLANLNFTVKDMNGAKVRLTDYKGKVILINFWATWCPPVQGRDSRIHRALRPVQGQGIRRPWCVGRRRRRDASDVCDGVEDQLPDARRARRGPAARRLRPTLRVSRRRSSWGATGRCAEGTWGRPPRRSSSGRSRRSCSMILRRC